MKLGLVSLGNQTNLEFERLSTTEFGVVAGEASTTLPGLWCECAKSRAARQNRRGWRRRRGRLSTVPSGPDPVRSLTIKFERNRWRWSQMASAFGRSISHAVPGRRISTPFTEIGRDEGVNRGMSFGKPPPFDSTRSGCPLGRVNPNSHRNRPVQSKSRDYNLKGEVSSGVTG